MKAILTKYHGPTNTRGSRISASDGDGNRVTVPYDRAARYPHDAAALALCAKLGWGGTLIRGSVAGGNVYVFDPREPSRNREDGDSIAEMAEAIIGGVLYVQYR